MNINIIGFYMYKLLKNITENEENQQKQTYHRSILSFYNQFIIQKGIDPVTVHLAIYIYTK